MDNIKADDSIGVDELETNHAVKEQQTFNLSPCNSKSKLFLKSFEF